LARLPFVKPNSRLGWLQGSSAGQVRNVACGTSGQGLPSASGRQCLSEVTTIQTQHALCALLAADFSRSVHFVNTPRLNSADRCDDRVLRMLDGYLPRRTARTWACVGDRRSSRDGRRFHCPIAPSRECINMATSTNDLTPTHTEPLLSLASIPLPPLHSKASVSDRYHG
jgi:hypothetical protein